MLWSLLVMVQLILCNEAGGAGRTWETVHSLVVVQSAHLQTSTVHTVRQTFQIPRLDFVLIYWIQPSTAKSATKAKERFGDLPAFVHVCAAQRWTCGCAGVSSGQAPAWSLCNRCHTWRVCGPCGSYCDAAGSGSWQRTLGTPSGHTRMRLSTQKMSLDNHLANHWMFGKRQFGDSFVFGS